MTPQGTNAHPGGARHEQRPTLPAKASVPPRWFERLFWKGHRAVYRLTGGRVGLWRAKPDRWGAMRVTTVGRRSGQERSVILGYLEDGPNLTALAMNGWTGPDPAWWLNLRADPHAHVRTKDREGDMVAHAAAGEERERLWAMWAAVDRHLDEYAAMRSVPTDIVVFVPAA